MNRRTCLAGLLVSLAAGKTMVVSAQTPETGILTISNEWVYDGISDPNIGLDSFEITIFAFSSEGEAHDAFERTFANVDDGAIYNKDTHNETFGDESFFVEFDNIGGLILVYEGTVRIKTLLFGFRWEASHFGGAREGHRLFESVIDRVETKNSYTQADLEAMLPTPGVLARLGLTAVN